MKRSTTVQDCETLFIVNFHLHFIEKINLIYASYHLNCFNQTQFYTKMLYPKGNIVSLHTCYCAQPIMSICFEGVNQVDANKVVQGLFLFIYFLPNK